MEQTLNKFQETKSTVITQLPEHENLNANEELQKICIDIMKDLILLM